MYMQTGSVGTEEQKLLCILLRVEEPLYTQPLPFVSFENASCMLFGVDVSFLLCCRKCVILVLYVLRRCSKHRSG